MFREVHVEDLFAAAEVADDVEDLFARIVEHLGDRALAEVEAVVRTLVHVYELRQAGGRTQYTGDATKTRRRVRVVRVACNSDFVLCGDGDDAFEEVVDAFPEHVFGDFAGDSRSALVGDFVEAEG